MRFTLRWTAWVATLSVVISGQARAGLITNGSFETGTNPPPLNSTGVALPDGSTALTGWTVIGGTPGDGLAWLPNGNPFDWTAPFGNYFLDLTGYDDRSPYFGVSQSISTAVGQSYILSLDIGVDESNSPGPISVRVQAGPDTQTFSVDPTGSGTIWTAFNVTFSADSAMSAISIQGTEGKFIIGLDNVSINPASVPEPGTLTLGGIATICSCLCLRRRGGKQG
jgi:hypothetical protein